MEINVTEIKGVIREEVLRGVPEFVLRQATSRYIEEIRKSIFKHILLKKSFTEEQRRDALADAQETLEEIEDTMNDVLDDSLYSFTRSS